MNKLNELKRAIKELYVVVDKLRAAFPDRSFTPDGRMVGDIGEAIAALKFNVIHDKKSQKDWDGHRLDSFGNKRMVQIKTTQKDETYLKEPPKEGDLLVFQINRSGEWRCCYDGPILKVWNSLKDIKSDNTNAKFIKLKKLERIK